MTTPAKEENKITRIGAVSTFIHAINKLEALHNVFYRGHSNEKWEITPGIYRELKNEKGEVTQKSLIEYEDEIYRDIIAKVPQAFEGKNTLESLALMQHYGAPTRVLDLTENALVALYFACTGDNKNDGEVLVFDIPDSHVCHYNSDRVSILANLAKCDKNFYHKNSPAYYLSLYDELINILSKEQKAITSRKITKIEKQIKKFIYLENKQSISELAENIIFDYKQDNFAFSTVFSKLTELISILEIELNKKLDDTEKNILNHYFFNHLINTIHNNKEEDIKHYNKLMYPNLLDYIKEDKPSFEPLIDPDDVSSVFAMRPKMDNPRIRQQQGAFLIFGIEQTLFSNKSYYYKPIAKLNNDWILRGKLNFLDLVDKLNEEPTPPRFIIYKNSKRKILKELEASGITQAALFPEIDTVAGYIRDKYQRKAQL